MPETKPDQDVKVIGTQGDAETLYKSPYFATSYDFPYNPDPYCSGNNYDIYDEMLDDEQVKVALELKKNFVLNSGWRVVVEDIKPQPEIKQKSLAIDYEAREEELLAKADARNADREKRNAEMEAAKARRCKLDAMAQEVTAGLCAVGKNDDYMGASFEDALRDILSAYPYGFSVTEPVYEIVHGKYVFKNFLTRPPHTFRFELDDKGRVVDVIQATARGDKRLSPQRLLHYVYQPEFGNPYGRSDLRAAHNAWKAKKFMLRFYARHMERFGSPTTVGRYAQGMDTAQIQRFHDLLAKIQNSTTVTIPEGALVEFLFATNNAGAAFKEALNFYDTQIARAILVPDLLGVSGSKTDGGSMALGKEQFNVFLGMVKRDREALARKLTLKCIQPLVRANYGPTYDARFEFTPYQDGDDHEMLRIWVEAVKGKVFKANEDEINHLRKAAGFPEGPVEMPEPMPIPQLGGPEQHQEQKDKKDLSAAGEVRIFRELTTHEKKVDFASARRILVTEPRNVKERIQAAGKVIYTDFIEQVREAQIIRRKDIGRLMLLQPRHLKDMNAALSPYFQTVYRAGQEQARRELFPAGDKRFAATETPAAKFLEMLRDETFKIVGDYSFHVTKKARDLIVQGLKDGAAQADIFALVRETLDTESDNWVQTVLQTKTTEFYNRSRKEYWDNDPLASQIVSGYEFSAILDDRTTEVCAHLDGRVFEKGEYAQRIMPPLHFNCRSQLVPVTIFEDFKPSPEVPIDKLLEEGGGKGFLIPKL